MRIILINQYAGGPQLGMEFRPHWMAKRWQAQGHEVLIVCGDRSHLRTIPKIERGYCEYEGVRFLSLSTTPYEVNGPARFANLLSFGAALRVASGQLARFEPEVVIASSTHPLDARPARRLARATGSKFVFEVHDLWPLTPRLLGGMSQRHPVIRMMQRDEDFAYRHADLVVSLLPNTEGYMKSHGLADGRWIWIPNGVDLAAAPLEPSPPLVAFHSGVSALRRSYHLVLVYAGTHGAANSLESLLKHAELIAGLGMAIALVGAGPMKDDLAARFGHHANVAFFDPVPRSEVAAALGDADCAYIGLAASPLFDYGISPNKIYDYMAAGIPVIENIGAANSPVADARCGLVADPRDPDSVLEALRRMAGSSDAQRRNWGDNGRGYVLEYLRQDSLADRMMEAIGSTSRRF